MRKLYISKNYLIIFLVFLTFGCDFNSEEETSCSSSSSEVPTWVNINQGIWGCIEFWEGNFMPGTSKTTGTIKPVVRAIHVYSSTSTDDTTSVEGSSSFYEYIDSELVAITYSDDDGLFQVELPAGQYSVFIGENEEFWANIVQIKGSKMIINPVSVKENTLTKHDVSITYRAYF